MRKLGWLFLGMAAAGLSQPRVEVRGTTGYSTFPDESFLHHGVIGGSARFYLTRRLSFEPEFLYMRKSRADQDYVFLPNVAFDLVHPGRKVVPYVIGGVGVLRHQELVGTGFYSSNTWTFGGGFGAKVFLSRRWFVAPEARVGWEPFIRATVSIGFVISPGSSE